MNLFIKINQLKSILRCTQLDFVVNISVEVEFPEFSRIFNCLKFRVSVFQPPGIYMYFHKKNFAAHTYVGTSLSESHFQCRDQIRAHVHLYKINYYEKN